MISAPIYLILITQVYLNSHTIQSFLSMKTMIFILFFSVFSGFDRDPAQAALPSPHTKTLTKNGMTVSWLYQQDRIYFELEAPTEGWIAIGFNSTNVLPGSYLLMGNLIAGKPEVVEHYTLRPGDYRPVSELGGSAQIRDVSGTESEGKTRIRFSVPIESRNQYAKNLVEGSSWTLHMAYSQEDDFQHHSRMRTAVEVQL